MKWPRWNTFNYSEEGKDKYFGVHIDTVYRWINRHTMLAHRMVRPCKVKKDKANEWLKANDAAAIIKRNPDLG